MQAAKHICIAVLIVMMLSSGLPLFSPEDASRDGRVDLEDAILRVRDFARTAENPGAFTASVEKVLSTLCMVAGLKTVIKPATDTNSTNTTPGLDLPYLIFSYDLSTPLNSCFQLPEESFHYQSLIFTPNPPPPQHTPIC